LVFVIEDGKEDAVHRGSIRKDAHWPGAASDFAKASFNGVGRADGFALSQGSIDRTDKDMLSSDRSP
jgi:hypothetical protein